MDLAVKNIFGEVIHLAGRHDAPWAIRTLVRSLAKQTRGARVSAAYVFVAAMNEREPGIAQEIASAIAPLAANTPKPTPKE